MRLFRQAVNLFNRSPWLLSLIIFASALSLFTYLAFDQTFADPDSFYHAKMAQVLASRGALTEFPWLSQTTLRYNFTDHHFLYHLILIPFVKVFPPLIGLKIATILFASLTILLVYWLLRQFLVKGAFWYALFLLTINPFIFRLNLAKAQGLVLIFLILLIYLIIHRHYLSLVFLSFFYVWLYGGWPLALMVVGVYAIFNWLWTFVKSSGTLVKQRRKKIFWQNVILIFCVALGITEGILLSPYFPRNPDFYWQQSFKIALVNYQHLINVGGEWYPYGWLELMTAASPFFILFSLAVIIFALSFKKQSLNAWFFLALSLIFFALTLKSRRYVEYFVPLSVVFSAVSLNWFWPTIKQRLEKFVSPNWILILPVLLLMSFSPIFYRDLKAIKLAYQNGFAFDKFLAPSLWLNQNSLPGEVVFHSDWDEFPILFYHNDFNYYLVGLDPTFMYESDPDLYQRWVGITTGTRTENIYSEIKKLFGANYVFVDLKDHSALARNLENNIYFEKVFEDDESRIYRLSDE
ncbi:MAG: hypothetical protein A2729_01685 [Candidatus Buchananbacteria bacterium RIFCSPHIGHO2_01_FULL_39_14]|uniref:Glycosyltransferase RgtA/B/C/D-like domain-containing protein n=2 Tax=Candidatus Buchananiibacteriota TaxID=1817903 RepID=A0A1G1YR49_9BACT|nr:MAG: hypothetical protein A2729_01685 [Candidatus Buchananbacteria bacterium RIFCSPHIGHO2_01_FULL_39_14]OGY48814.1 MAG: hypothetical protein A3D39_03355 [Candidatus Buchananbacteria bacterium RIFCSPHIGHO2_02_FULL_39_17]OGY54100.1 MAG: hypothetical protein A2912_01880 [Candidatus Buchananbacteria bacterium RIFCSPLOWO2_01_FULL_40_23b]